MEFEIAYSAELDILCEKTTLRRKGTQREREANNSMDRELAGRI
jgi:hypothetical protein